MKPFFATSLIAGSLALSLVLAGCNRGAQGPDKAPAAEVTAPPAGPVPTVAATLVWRQLPPAARPGGAPRIERTRLEEAPTPPPSAPDPDWLLRQKEFVGLSAAQGEKLEKRKARWDRDTKELRGALGRAAAHFRRGVETQGGGRSGRGPGVSPRRGRKRTTVQADERPVRRRRPFRITEDRVSGRMFPTGRRR